MKKLIFALVALLATPVCINAQNVLDKFHLEAGLGIGTAKDKTMPFEVNVDLNYSLTSRFSVHALAEASFFVPKDGATHDYNKAANLGGGVGYVLFPATGDSKDVFEVRATAAANVGSSDFKHTSYKLGLYWLNDKMKVGIGYSLRDFSSKGFDTYHGAFATIGFRL